MQHLDNRRIWEAKTENPEEYELTNKACLTREGPGNEDKTVGGGGEMQIREYNLPVIRRTNSGEYNLCCS